MHLLKTVFLICFAFVSAGAIGSTLVESDVGSIEGFEKNGMECFRGIPYAENTAGERRFAPSVEKTKLQHHLKAFHFCPVVPQSGPIGRRSSSGMAEDSLCLNIYRPKNSTKGANYPVLVWIHGGSYVIGSSSSALYETGAFPRDGVILVTLNYRLNGLGFLASKTALREYGTTGNYGHLDIVTALKWIKHNIESFGGNPDNITLGGHSAGAFAVSSLILSPLADGLFSKAILQSGTILNYPFSDFYPHRARSRALKSSNLLFSMFGADDSYEGLNLLRKVDPLLISYNTPFDFDLYSNPTAYINPYFDGKVIPLDPLKALRDGHYNQVKLLLGYTTDEGSLFSDPMAKKEHFISSMNRFFGARRGALIEKLYTVDDKNSTFKRQSEFLGDIMFNLGMKIFADEISKNNAVYLYHFDYASKEDLETGYGIRHGSDLSYVFGYKGDMTSSADIKILNNVHSRYVNFVKTGDPNTDGSSKLLFKWNVYRREEPTAFRFSRFSGNEPFKLEERLSALEKIILADYESVN